MPRFAANITFLFTELPFLDRFAAAADAGFRGVEFHYPYDVDPAAIVSRLERHRLTPVLMNVRAGDHSRGEWGFASAPDRVETFRLCVTEAIHYALAIGVKQVNCLAGAVQGGGDIRASEQVFVRNMREAAAQFADFGLTLNLEPINTRDVPGYLVSNTRDAIRLMNDIQADNLKLQYDWYHMQIMEPDSLADTMRLLLLAIGHMQFADAPGRHEPGSGQIDFPALFAHVDAIGYQGWLSAEYRPSGATADSLGWMANYLQE
ncbi:MAG: TIM barrel protein [Betaproteobacteria bacterium]|nr:TIM barrel protein [Betaproteobacteria bacterium]